MIRDLTHEARARAGCAGVPVTLSDGREWLLHDGGLLNELDALRDQLDDDARLTGEIGLFDVANAAGVLLVANYDLTADEVRSLIVDVVDQALADAVCLALFGPPNARRTYTSWAASALLANGLDPTKIPVELMPHVLAQLEGTGRCIPRGQYIEAAEAATRLASVRARVRPAEPETSAEPIDLPGVTPTDG